MQKHRKIDTYRRTFSVFPVRSWRRKFPARKGRAYLPERVRMVCHSEAAAAVYRQTWNLWYAEEKDQRL